MFGGLSSGGIVAAVCAALLVGAAVAEAQPVRGLRHPDPITMTGSCKTPHTEIITSDQPAGAYSTDWQPVDNGTINFVSKRAGCVIVAFSGIAYSEVDDLFMQMVLDGATVCGPSYGFEEGSIVDGPDAVHKAISMTYFCKDVAPGSHSLQAQYATRAGNLAEFLSHTMMVSHN